jgi:hypothetical protein
MGIYPGCSQGNPNPLERLLKNNSKALNPVISDPEHYEVQIIYTQIDRDINNFPTFQSFHFRVDSEEYFYPASTIKMPVALLAVERMNRYREELGKNELSLHSRIEFDSARLPQTAVRIDESSRSGYPSIAHYIKKIFLVSDNDAFNRLYEFLGRDAINQALIAKGYKRTRVFHRLSAPDFDYEINRFANPFRLFVNGEVVFERSELESTKNFLIPLNGMRKGKGYVNRSGETIRRPFDFSRKNVFALQDFEAMLRAVIFPEAVPLSKRFRLSDSDYQSVHRWMSSFPRESVYPRYDETEFYDGYSKFLILGDSRDRAPDSIRIFNKTGMAYGYLTDCAYVVDFDEGVEFILAATVNVNSKIKNLLYPS